jgi:hypothetical protein
VLLRQHQFSSRPKGRKIGAFFLRSRLHRPPASHQGISAAAQGHAPLLKTPLEFCLNEILPLEGRIGIAGRIEKGIIGKGRIQGGIGIEGRISTGRIAAISHVAKRQN